MMKHRLSALAPIALAAACAASTPSPRKPNVDAKANKPNAAAQQAGDDANRCWMLIDAVRLATHSVAACDLDKLDKLVLKVALMKETCDRAEAQKPPTLRSLQRDRRIAESHAAQIKRYCTPNEEQPVP